MGRHRWCATTPKTVEGGLAFTLSVVACAWLLRVSGFTEEFSVSVFLCPPFLPLFASIFPYRSVSVAFFFLCLVHVGLEIFCSLYGAVSLGFRYMDRPALRIEPSTVLRVLSFLIVCPGHLVFFSFICGGEALNQG